VVAVETAVSLWHYTFSERLIGVATLNSAVFDDIRDDSAASQQALLILLVPTSLRQLKDFQSDPARAILFALLGLVLGYLISTVFFGIAKFWLVRATSWEQFPGFLRTFAFSCTPAFLDILSPAPVIGRFIFPIITAWVLATSTIAVRQALGISTWRSIAVLACPSLVPFVAICPVAIFLILAQ
jgi:hypothetical protein